LPYNEWKKREVQNIRAVDMANPVMWSISSFITNQSGKEKP
jgi:hypothetical protein